MFNKIIKTKTIMIILLISFFIALCYQLYLEKVNKSDSIGFIYTLYCAIVFTIEISIPILITYCVYKVIKIFVSKKKQQENKGQA
jgi:glucan phosphoethanolaminetransferase (alkaline phosphatase superfamily)